MLKNGEVMRIGTITSRVENGRCVFLDAQDRCRVHPVAPFGCAYFDIHMGGRMGNARSAWGLERIIVDAAYAALRALLPNATSYNPRGPLTR